VPNQLVGISTFVVPLHIPLDPCVHNTLAAMLGSSHIANKQASTADIIGTSVVAGHTKYWKSAGPDFAA